MWRNLCGSLAAIVPPPSGSELWYDEANIPFLREDAERAANIIQVQASTITELVREGYKADSTPGAVTAGDLTQLEHTGLVSVQLQPLLSPDSPAALPPTSNGAEAPPAGVSSNGGSA
jgi:hypothetical protein